MAETFDGLFSVGPGSLGPGTHVVYSATNPSRNSGVVTRIRYDETGLTTSDLAGLYTLSDANFPGTSGATAIPLDYTFVKHISNTHALVVSHYGQGNSSSGFRTVMTRTPGGMRNQPFWDATNAYTRARENYDGPLDKKRLRPKYILDIPLITVQWSDVVYQDTQPTDFASLIGKVNSASATIDGYTHAAKTLRYEGTQIRHDKNGGYDRWTIGHTATYDPFYFWKRSDDLTFAAAAAGDPGTWDVTLSNGGSGEDQYTAVSFASLPGVS